MTGWLLTEDGVDWSHDLSNIELWDGVGSPIRASGIVDSWFTGEEECPVPMLNDGVDFFAYKYWKILPPCHDAPLGVSCAHEQCT